MKRQTRRLYKRFTKLRPFKKALLIVTILGFFMYSSAVVAYNVGHTTNLNDSNSKAITTSLKTNAPLIKAKSLVRLFNGQRTANGLASLQENSQLDEAASARANDMITKNYQDSSSHDPWSFITNTGYKYKVANLQYASGYNSAQDIINGWLKSADSAKVFSVKGVTELGVAVVQQGANKHSQLVVMYQASPLEGQITQSMPTYDPLKEAQFNIKMTQYKTCENASSTYYQYLTDEQSAADSDEKAQQQAIEADSSLTNKEKDTRITAIQKAYNDRVNSAYGYYQKQMKNFGCTPVEFHIFNYTLPYTYYEDFDKNYQG